jgi:cell wall-associated NlpC family hydrolase
MSRATLRARLGVTAATVIAGLGLTLAPGLASAANAGTPGALSAGFSLSATPSQPASRHHLERRTAHARMVHHHNLLVHKVLNEARRQKGKPYSYGAAGPGAFDCSGLVMYVFAHSVHRYLPHNAAAQYHSLHHIKRRQLEKGDLVFTDNGYISHVGIFAGHHHWWVAPQTGTRVHKQRIYHAHFLYARVLRLRHHH